LNWDTLKSTKPGCYGWCEYTSSPDYDSAGSLAVDRREMGENGPTGWKGVMIWLTGEKGLVIERSREKG
jgi:hypothetical protein